MDAMTDKAPSPLRSTAFFNVSSDSSSARSQACAIKLIKGRKQLAQGQIAKRAEQGKGARFNRNRRHDVCSFIKLSYKYLFSRHHSRENVVITTTFSQNTDSEWWSVGAISRIGHRYGPYQRPNLHSPAHLCAGELGIPYGPRAKFTGTDPESP